VQVLVWRREGSEVPLTAAGLDVLHKAGNSLDEKGERE
jgi:hypothetical protein